MAAFNRNSVFDGDDVHKATSIHLQIDVKSMLDNLPVDATVYVQNENELEAVGATNNLRGLAANVKFISNDIVNGENKNVNGNILRSSRNQTKTDSFKRWFGDWQNDPQNASKVVNADGTPKRLYRYTNLEDTVIKPDYHGAIWMADNDWVTIGIETHNRNEIGYKPDPSLNNMYVLVSAFRDGGLITPVKLEIKEFNHKANSLYDAIALESFPADNVTEKKSRIVTEGTTNNGVAQTIPPLTIKLADLFANVNPNDESFLKYVPKQFLSDNHVKSDEYVLKSSRTNQDSMLGRLEKQNERLQEELDYLKQLVKIQKSGNKARFPGESGKEKTSVCTGFANMPLACWI